LAHEFEQVGEGFFLGLLTLGGELFGPSEELGCHPGALIGRAAHGLEELGQLVRVHGGLVPFLDADAFHLDAGGGFAIAFTAGAIGCGGGGDLLEDVIPIGELAEGGVLPIEEGGVAVADEELGTGGVGVLGAGHGDDAAHVGSVVELGFDFVAGAAGAEHVFIGGVFGIGVAALDHEALDDAVKAGAVIEAFGG
jgi:hypothetical protein